MVIKRAIILMNEAKLVKWVELLTIFFLEKNKKKRNPYRSQSYNCECNTHGREIITVLSI